MLPASHWKILSLFGVLGVGLLATPATLADNKHQIRSPAARALAFKPVIAVVSLRDQRVSFYDARGSSLRAPISSGQHGLETPAGVYAVLEKDVDHHSNVYDDAAMPFMQRITWTGLALHAGVLPGYPASHGCVRMPYSFAEQVFPLTQVGLRVVISPDDFVPVFISHRLLSKFSSSPTRATALSTAIADNSNPEDLKAYSIGENPVENDRELEQLKTIAANADSAARTAARIASELKADLNVDLATRTKAAKARRSADIERRAATNQLARAAAMLTASQIAASTRTDRNDLANAVSASQRAAMAVDEARMRTDDAVTRFALARTNLETNAKNSSGRKATGIALAKLKQELASAQKRLREAMSRKHEANERIGEAERTLFAASRPRWLKRDEDAKDAAQAGNAAAMGRFAIAESEFENADKQLAVSRAMYAEAEKKRAADAEAAAIAIGRTRPFSIFVSLKTQRLYVRQAFQAVLDVPITIADPARPVGTYVFTAVSLDARTDKMRWTAVAIGRTNKPESAPETVSTNAQDAAAVLDRIVMPPEIFARFSGYVLPGSSIIVSDEPMSKETGQDTDFIVVMSTEPQGGLKSRKLEVYAARRKSRKNDDEQGGSYGPEHSPFFTFW